MKLTTTLFYTVIGLSVANSQIRTDGFDNLSVLPRGDDNSTSASIDFGFEIDYAGQTGLTGAFINTNGMVTFGTPISEFDQSDVIDEDWVILAPFFSDISTEGALAQNITYGQGLVDGNSAFVVNYIDVGLFQFISELDTSIPDDRLNSFQLVIIDRPELGGNSFEFEFNYEQIQFNSADFSALNDLAIVAYAEIARDENGDIILDQNGNPRAALVDAITGLPLEQAHNARLAQELADFLAGRSAFNTFIDGSDTALIDEENTGVPGRLAFVVTEDENGDITVFEADEVSDRPIITDGEVDPVLNVLDPTLTDQVTLARIFDIGETANTLRNSTFAIGKGSTTDLNHRLLRYRTGRVGAPDSFVGVDNRFIEAFASYQFYSQNIDPQPAFSSFGDIRFQGSEVTSNNATVGLELKLSEVFRLGFTGIFTDGEINEDGGGFNADHDSMGGAVYASAYFKDIFNSSHDFYVDGLYAKVSGDITTSRDNPTPFIDGLGNLIPVVPRSIGETEYDYEEFALNAGFIFENHVLRHGPYVNLTRSQSESASFTDSSLRDAVTAVFPENVVDDIPSVTRSSTTVQVGYQVSAQILSDLNTDLYPNTRIAYETELGGDSFFLDGQIPNPELDALIIGAGLLYDPGSLSGAIDFEYKDFQAGGDSFSVSVRVAARF